MCAQGIAVAVDTIQHDRGNGEYHAGRREFSFSEDVVDETTVQPTIAILEGMDVDKSERRRCRLQYSIDVSFAHTLICFDHSAQQIHQVNRARADKLGQWLPLMIALAEENAVGPQSRMYEARVLDQHAVEAKYFLDR